MLIAKDKSENRYYAPETERGPDFYCPQCNEPVFIKKGQKVIHHYSHFKDPCIMWEPESPLHLEMKLFFKNMFEHNWKFYIKLIELEYQIENLFCDVYIETVSGIKIAIECQLYTKSIEDIINKTKIYSQNGIYTWWVFSIKEFNPSTFFDINFYKKGLKNKLTKMHKLYLKNIYDSLFFFANDNIIKLKHLELFEHEDWKISRLSSFDEITLITNNSLLLIGFIFNNKPWLMKVYGIRTVSGYLLMSKFYCNLSICEICKTRLRPKYHNEGTFDIGKMIILCSSECKDIFNRREGRGPRSNHPTIEDLGPMFDRPNKNDSLTQCMYCFRWFFSKSGKPFCINCYLAAHILADKQE